MPVGAYPRERGGTYIKHPPALLANGLSPRTRGNLTGAGGAKSLIGPIPANAQWHSLKKKPHSLKETDRF